MSLRRREFIAALGCAAAWPVTAQHGNRVQRIGVLIPGDENAPVRKTYVSAFTQALAGLGWMFVVSLSKRAIASEIPPPGREAPPDPQRGPPDPPRGNDCTIHGDERTFTAAEMLSDRRPKGGRSNTPF
jgi:hypothetical protein